MKNYLKKIQRRLNLPKTVRERVMSDLASSVTARQEAGQSDEAIMAELGSPKKVAAELNEQMKEYAYRKSPWRFAFLGAAVLAGVKLASDVIPAIVGYWVLRIFEWTRPEAASIGIIGGADGPTAIFITAPDWTGPVLALAVLAIGIVGFLRLSRCKGTK